MFAAIGERGVGRTDGQFDRDVQRRRRRRLAFEFIGENARGDILIARGGVGVVEQIAVQPRAELLILAIAHVVQPIAVAGGIVTCACNGEHGIHAAAITLEHEACGQVAPCVDVVLRAYPVLIVEHRGQRHVAAGRVADIPDIVIVAGEEGGRHLFGDGCHAGRRRGQVAQEELRHVLADAFGEPHRRIGRRARQGTETALEVVTPIEVVGVFVVQIPRLPDARRTRPAARGDERDEARRVARIGRRAFQVDAAVVGGIAEEGGGVGGVVVLVLENDHFQRVVEIVRDRLVFRGAHQGHEGTLLLRQRFADVVELRGGQVVIADAQLAGVADAGLG